MIFFVILILIACILLGLAGNVAGFSNQFMGVKQTTDVLEKGTWVLAVIVVLLCLFSTVFIPKAATKQLIVFNSIFISVPAYSSHLTTLP